MSHVGVAIDHPLNAQILAYLTQRPSAIERSLAIRSLEAIVAKSPTPILLSALQKLRDNKPDAARTPSQSPEGVSLLSLGALPEIVERLWKAGLALPTDCRWVSASRARSFNDRNHFWLGCRHVRDRHAIAASNR